jgi:NADP-dependent 3-hydroxy acid dehydrogenase YdfG
MLQQCLQQNGAKRILIARSAKTLKHLAARIANAGGQAIDVVADVADREKCASRPKPLDFLGYVGLRT